MNKNKHKKSYANKDIALEIKRKERERYSFQEFLPIVDIVNGCYVDKMGIHYPVIAIGTKNLDLMSHEEKLSLASDLEEIYGSFKAKRYQISLTPMPYDSSEWNEFMSRTLEEIDEEKFILHSKVSKAKSEFEKQKILSDIKILEARKFYLKEERDFVIEKIQSGRLTTKKSFLSLEFEEAGDVKTTVRKARQIIDRFKAKDIEASLCSEKELRNLLNVLTNPLQTSMKNISRINLPPNYNRGDDM